MAIVYNAQLDKTVLNAPKIMSTDALNVSILFTWANNHVINALISAKNVKGKMSACSVMMVTSWWESKVRTPVDVWRVVPCVKLVQSVPTIVWAVQMIPLNLQLATSVWKNQGSRLSQNLTFLTTSIGT